MKLVWPILGSGPALFQLKFTMASVRVRVGNVLNVTLVKAVLVVLVQYWPDNPVPLPMAELLTKLAMAAPLFTAPACAATTASDTLFVNRKGPV